MARAWQPGPTALFRAIPALPRGFLQRPRIDALLDAGATRRMTLVCAPAGSGKTLMVSSWARRRAEPNPVAWIDCGWIRETPTAFWEAVISGLGDVAPPPAAARPPAPGVAADRRELLDWLLRWLAALPSGTVIVLDDFHRIRITGTYHDLQYVLDRLPEGVVVIMLSRTVPPLALHRARIEDRLVDLRSDDLAFTPDETAELLRANDLDLEPQAAEQLHQQTQGWAAGLRLAMMSMRQTGDPWGVIERLRRSSDALSGYLTEQVLAELDPDDVAFLYDTCVADRLTDSLVEALTRAPDGLQQLRRVADRVGFLSKAGDIDDSYRYHPMFAEILRRQLQHADPDRMADRSRRAATWYSDHGLPLAAVDAALRGGDREFACEVLVTDVVDLAGRGYVPELAEVLRRLPQDLLDTDIRAQLVRAIVGTMGDRCAEADRLLGQVARRLPPGAEPPARRLRATHAVAAALLARRRADVEGVLRALPDTEPDLPEPGDPGFRPQDQGLRVSWRGHRAVALLWDDQVEAARAIAAQNRDMARESGSHWQELSALGVLAVAAAASGDLSGCDTHTREFAATLNVRGWSAQSFLALPEVAECWAAIERGDEAGATTALARARQCADRLPGGFVGPLQQVVEARIEGLGWDSPPSATPRPLPGGLEPPDQTPRLVRRLGRRVAVERFLAHGDLPAASRIADDDPGLLTLVAARSGTDLVLDGGPGLVPAAESALSSDLGMTVRVVLAAAVTKHRAGQTSAADRLLARALALADTHGYVLPFIELAEQAHALLLDAPVSSLRHPDLVAGLLGATGPVRQNPRPAAAPLTPKEVDILRHLATRSQLDEIADQLYVSVNTVRTHTRNAYRKLGAVNRRDAVLRAAELGIL